MSSYIMSTYLLPKSICHKMDPLFRRFWWGFKDDARGLCLKAWDTICTRKSNGGLGLRRMWDQNKAQIAKLGWAVVSSEDRLWVRLLRFKYLGHVPLRNHLPSSKASWVWQGITQCKDLVLKGACLMIGNGVGIDIWEDP